MTLPIYDPMGETPSGRNPFNSFLYNPGVIQPFKVENKTKFKDFD